MNTTTIRTQDALADGATSMLSATSKAAGQVMDGVAQDAAGLMQRSSTALHERSEQLKAQAQQARDMTVGYIQQEPLKAVLMAAAAGAALVLLGSLLSRSSR